MSPASTCSWSTCSWASEALPEGYDTVLGAAGVEASAENTPRLAAAEQRFSERLSDHVSLEDVAYLREKHKELNQMLATQAAANGASLVDAYSAGIGHDACQLPVQRWVEPEEPVSAAAPYHPNLGGMEGTARVLRAAVSKR